MVSPYRRSGSLLLSSLVGGQSSPSFFPVSLIETGFLWIYAQTHSGMDTHMPLIPKHTYLTYGIAIRTLQFEVTVELVWGQALALHLSADMEGAAPGAIFAAVNDVAPTALKTRETYLGCDWLQLLKGHASQKERWNDLSFPHSFNKCSKVACYQIAESQASWNGYCSYFQIERLPLVFPDCLTPRSPNS